MNGNIGKVRTEIHKMHYSLSKLGSKNPSWKGGKMDSRGYTMVLKRGHPMANCNGYILEHRYIMSEHIGRPLEKDEFVHHKDGNSQNNAIENLELIKGRPDHSRKHIYTTNKHWFYIKSGLICPHCNKEIALEQITKVGAKEEHGRKRTRAQEQRIHQGEGRTSQGNDLP